MSNPHQFTDLLIKGHTWKMYHNKVWEHSLKWDHYSGSQKEGKPKREWQADVCCAKH